jgi:HK97 family phage major capsid protein
MAPHALKLRTAPSRADDDAMRAAAMWLKAAFHADAEARAWCRVAGIMVTRGQSEGANALGGYLVPSEMSDAIIANRERAGIFRKYATVVPMSSDVKTQPLRTSGVTASWVGEGVALTESQPVLADVNLVVKKLAAMVRASAEVEEDAVDLATFLSEEFGNALAIAEDAAGFLGDGTSTYGGHTGINTFLLDGAHNAGKVAAGAAHNTLLTIDATDLANVVAATPSYALESAAWYVGTRARGSVFTRLAATGGGLMMIGDELCYGGFPVRTTSQLLNTTATATAGVMLLFGALDKAASLGDRRGMTMGRAASRLMDQDQVLFRATERVTIVNHSLGDNTNAGPIVALIGTA